MWQKRVDWGANLNKIRRAVRNTYKFKESQAGETFPHVPNFRWPDNRISVIPVAIISSKALRARAADEAGLGINGQGGNELSGVVRAPFVVLFDGNKGQLQWEAHVQSNSCRVLLGSRLFKHRTTMGFCSFPRLQLTDRPYMKLKVGVSTSGARI